MNKKIMYGLLGGIAVLALLFFFIQSDTEEPGSPDHEGGVKVAATIFPIYDIARTVAGDAATVELILPPGASPHTFDPTPSTLTKLQGSQVVFSIGQGLDAWVDGVVENIPGAEVEALDQHISLRESSEAHGHDDHEEEAHDDHGHEEAHAHEHDDHEHEEEADAHDDHAHGEFDPHYWLDPDNAVIIANAIAEELSDIDPDNATVYQNNASSFAEEIEDLDEVWKQFLGQLPARDIVTFHDAFAYFADHFSLTVVTTFEPFPGKEPTPSYLQELEHEVEEHGISVLFTEPQLHGASLEQFAKDHGVSIGILDPLGGVDDRDSYTALIQYNVQTIGDALR